MKYLVMETHPAYAVVLDEEGRFLKAANLQYRVGDTVQHIVELRQARPRAPALWKPLSGLAAAAACLGNVFERVLTEEEGEEIRSIKEALLRHGALGAAMSGSGPTVFGLFDDRQKAVRAKEALEGRYRQTYLAAPVKILEKME